MLTFVILFAGILPTVFLWNLTKAIKKDNARIISILDDIKEK